MRERDEAVSSPGVGSKKFTVNKKGGLKKALAKRCQAFPLTVSFRIATSVLQLS